MILHVVVDEGPPEPDDPDGVLSVSRVAVFTDEGHARWFVEHCPDALPTWRIETQGAT